MATTEDFLTAAPSWITTSISWLRNSPYASYMIGRRGEPERQLASALRAMDFLSAEAVIEMGWPTHRKHASGLIDKAVKGWKINHHRQMMAYLQDGGLNARLKQVGATGPAAEPEPDEDVGVTFDVTEREMADGTVAITFEPETAEQQLASAIDAFTADDRMGAW